MKFEVTLFEARRVRKLGSKLLRQVVQYRLGISIRLVVYFCGMYMSLSTATPWNSYYNRALYDCHAKGRRIGKCKVRINHQAMRGIRFWRELACSDLQLQPIRPLQPEEVVYTDGADVGYGGTLHFSDFRLGKPRLYCNQEVW